MGVEINAPSQIISDRRTLPSTEMRSLAAWRVVALSLNVNGGHAQRVDFGLFGGVDPTEQVVV
jgi:hypothetical protein